jgi:two-component system response regulator YesN
MINLLIVDDDIATVEVIKDSIHWGEVGIDAVYTAYNVPNARKVLTDQKVDIIISDIEMPQETGLDLLKWVREEKLECEFLLLTCHEKFSYATNAIHYEAAAYLTKPFDLAIMELNLQKIITKLRQKRDLQKNSEYGEWMEKNLRFMKLDFWKDILEGEISESRLGTEIISRHLDISEDKRYCLVYTKMSNIEGDIERYGKNVLEFVLEEFQSEILTGQVENESVVKFHTEDNLSYITVCDEKLKEGLKEKCEKLLETCRGYFKASITCCISNDYSMPELSIIRKKLAKLFDYNVGVNSKTFHEDEVELTSNSEIQILDLEKLVTFVENKDRARILNYLKQIFDELSNYKKLNRHSLYLMKQEIMQVVYADLMKQGIQATRLFYDEFSIKLADHAINSTVDMIRWVNYLLEKTFKYEEEVAKSATIIEKINKYIHEHYMEDIGRNEISAEFYLTPEYLAKLYKKKTGINLKDYINEYRIEKAKELLRAGEKNISNIAESVGFDNFTYFSTLFKKITGVSPKDYKKK